MSGQGHANVRSGHGRTVQCQVNSSSRSSRTSKSDDVKSYQVQNLIRSGQVMVRSRSGQSRQGQGKVMAGQVNVMS